MNIVCYLFIFLSLMSCFENSETDIIFDIKVVLSDFLHEYCYFKDSEIVCAASNEVIMASFVAE